MMVILGDNLKKMHMKNANLPKGNYKIIHIL